MKSKDNMVNKYHEEGQKPKKMNVFYDVLMKVKEKIEQNGLPFVMIEKKKTSSYVWFSDKQGIIGNLDAHYEFHKKKDNISVNIHFEIAKTRDLFHQHISSIPETVKWIKWHNSKSLRYHEQYKIDEPDLAEKLTNALVQLDKAVGDEVRRVVLNKNTLLIGNNAELKNSLDLLKYKKQIILQGPPGTGKTRMAKEIAKELTKPVGVGKPEKIIDKLVKEFDAKDEEVVLERKEHQKLLYEFYKLFPKEDLKDLSLEAYCTGTGERDNFCWWLERGLKPLGYYSPGSSRSYLIYWKKDTEEYSKHGFVKDIEDDDKAMQQLAYKIHEFVESEDFEKVSPYFGDSFLLKILNTYYPDKYFPINSKKMINNALALLGIEYNKLNVFEKNKKLNDYYLHKKQQFKSDINALEFSRILFENFNIKHGEFKDVQHNVVAKGASKIIQFHPSYNYEDFVRGIVAESEKGTIYYRNINKVLGDFAQTALDNPNGNYVLIIDEINRANLSSVLGELIYALEYRGESVDSIYEVDGSNEIILPPNLYIIRTMNTADRSVGHIDYAIRRRFAFVDVLPRDLSGETDIKFYKDLFDKVQNLFIEDNDYNKRSNHLSLEFDPKDVALGHSYFIDKSDEGADMSMRLEYEIKPILMEYVKDGVLIGDDIIDKINILASSK